MKYACYLFDLDGTLVDSLLDLHQAVNHVVTSRGNDALSVDVVRAYIGDGVKVLLARSLLGKEPPTTEETRTTVPSDLLKRAEEIHDLDAGLEEFRAFYIDHVVDHTQCYEGVRETLVVLETAGVSLGVVSNKPEAPTKKILDALGILDHFDAVVGGDTVGTLKPDPAPVLHALKTLGHDASEALMIGDSANDVLAGRRAGCDTVAVTYGFTARETLEAHRPGRIVERFGEILD
jgi:phosphoglycolate phosphatase